jgi:glycine oxidase
MDSQGPDVVVIGAGIVGSSIAWRLAQTGGTVALLDAGTLGAEASWAGAGMLAPGGEIGARTAWGQFALESLGQYPAFVQELERESGFHIDYRACGAIEIAATAAEWQDLLERRRAQAEIGIRSSVTNAVPDVAGALDYPDDAIVDPRDVTRALRVACQARQVRIYEQTRVHAIRLSRDHVEVDSSAGELSASAAVLAAGAWSGEIPVTSGVERLEIPATFPVRGHLLGYALEPGSLGPILRHGHTYLLQRGNGFTIAGTSSEQVGFDRSLDPQIVADIHQRACALMGRLSTAAKPEAWLGFRPATADFEPRIGRFRDTRLWLAYGHYRNGILMAPATAQRLSRLIMSNSEMDLAAPGGCH